MEDRPDRWNKTQFFQADVGSILLYGCTTWLLTKFIEKKLDGNNTRMLWAVLNKSWKQHPTKQKLCGHQPPITKTIHNRLARHAGHFLRSNDEIMSDMFLWTPSYGRAKLGRSARTYMQQLCDDTVCSLENLLGGIDDRVREIHSSSVAWWLWLVRDTDNIPQFHV